MNNATTDRAEMAVTAETKEEIAGIRSAAEAAGNHPLQWLCDGALAGDVGALATARKRHAAK